MEGSCDPARDIDIIDLELVMADLEMVERRIEKDTKAGKGDKKYLHSPEVFKGLRDCVNEGKSARSYVCDEEEREILNTADLAHPEAGDLRRQPGRGGVQGTTTTTPITRRWSRPRRRRGPR